MNNSLFDEFNEISPAAWKQKIQVELDGADYNETLLWKTDEGITVKPFYTKEDVVLTSYKTPKNTFNICQSIFIDNEKIANNIANNALTKGANAIEFIATKTFNYTNLFKNLDTNHATYFFRFQFLDEIFTNELATFLTNHNVFYEVDIIGQLAESGNWFHNLKEDHFKFEKIIKNCKNSIGINATLYQNAGATIVQQLAYTLAHANEYLNHYGSEIASKMHINFSVGSNYFFEIAKLRAFRILWKTLVNEYTDTETAIHIFTQPSLRNKTIYDYNVNMLRTTSECMSAILGGSDTVNNIAYDALYHKKNEFGERISRNQLLILQQESNLENTTDAADGAYYIENLTMQLAEKALLIFKDIEKSGGFIKQLKEGTIQRKIVESAVKEQNKFNKGELSLIGSNKQPNRDDKMKNELELYPFLKSNQSKTLISPIIKKRLTEVYEKDRLQKEAT